MGFDEVLPKWPSFSGTVVIYHILSDTVVSVRGFVKLLTHSWDFQVKSYEGETIKVEWPHSNELANPSAGEMTHWARLGGSLTSSSCILAIITSDPCQRLIQSCHWLRVLRQRLMISTYQTVHHRRHHRRLDVVSSLTLHQAVLYSGTSATPLATLQSVTQTRTHA